MITLSPEWEQTFVESLVGTGEEKQLSLAPSRLQEFISEVRQTFERHAMMGEMPILLTSPPIRPFVRSIIERFRACMYVYACSDAVRADVHIILASYQS